MLLSSELLSSVCRLPSLPKQITGPEALHFDAVFKAVFLRCTLLQSDNLNAREALCFFHAEIPASGASSVLEQSV